MKKSHLKILNGVLIAFCITSGVFVVLLFAPHSPITPTVSVRMKLVSFIPQGWNFFTRDPQETRNWLFRGDDTLASLDPVALRGNGLFSFAQRSWRVRTMEMGRLLAATPLDAWKDCKAKSARLCAKAAPTAAFRIVNPMRVKSLCGPLVVVQRRMTPWALFARGQQPSLPGKVARLEVSC